jgi:hypothetical protein
MYKAHATRAKNPKDIAVLKYSKASVKISRTKSYAMPSSGIAITKKYKNKKSFFQEIKKCIRSIIGSRLADREQFCTI